MKGNAGMSVDFTLALFVSFADAADVPSLDAIKSQAELDEAIAVLVQREMESRRSLLASI
jgi:hypothetical protein